MRVERGKLLVQRYSAGLNPVDNRHGTAPARRGYWAMPWPHHDAFFSAHKVDEVIPRRLSRVTLRGLEEAGARRDDLALLYEERERWAREVAPRVLKVHTMWWGGPILACFDPAGVVRRDWLDGGRWTELTVEEFVKGARRISHGIDTYVYRPPGGGPGQLGRGLSTDHLEMFLPVR